MYLIYLIIYLSHSSPSTSPKLLHLHFCLPFPNVIYFSLVPIMSCQCCQHAHGCGAIYGRPTSSEPSKNNDFPYLCSCQLLITPQKRIGLRKHLPHLWGKFGRLDLSKSWAGFHRWCLLMNALSMPCSIDKIFTEDLTNLRLLQYFHLHFQAAL